MEFPIYSALAIAAGVYFGVRNIRLLKNEAALRQYITTSPKAAAWVQKYGIEGAMKMAKETTVPLGLIISVVLLGIGCYGLFKYAQYAM